MKVRIDNAVVVTEPAPEGFYVIDSKGRRVSHHRFPYGTLQYGVSQSFRVNGHHYKTGNLIDESCDCERCSSASRIHYGS
jgi:hypothetical protein